MKSTVIKEFNLFKESLKIDINELSEIISKERIRRNREKSDCSIQISGLRDSINFINNSIDILKNTMDAMKVNTIKKSALNKNKTISNNSSHGEINPNLHLIPSELLNESLEFNNKISWNKS